MHIRTRVTLGMVLAVGLIAGGYSYWNNSRGTAGAVSSAGPPVSADLLKASAASTQNEGTVAFTVTMSVKGTPLGDQTVTGHGAADFAQQQATFDGQLLGTPFTSVLDNTTVYIQSALLGPGWYRLDPATLGKASASAPFVLPISSPAQAFDLLKSVSDNVQLVGQETIGGVQTTHYRATVDLNTAAATLGSHETVPAGQSTVPVDAWVDGQGLIAQVTIDYTGAALGMGSTGASEVSLTIDCSGYGQPVSITVPPAGDVKDFSQSTLGAFVGSFGGPAH